MADDKASAAAPSTPTHASSTLTHASSTPSASSPLTLPSPIITRRNRTKSTCEIALANPEVMGTIKSFCRQKGHGFISPQDGSTDLFVHISDVDGEYVPQTGDEVRYRLCPIPPKCDKMQATHVQ